MDFLGTGASSDEGESDGPIIRATMNISSVPSVSVGQRTNRYQDAPYATAPVKNVPYQKQVTEVYFAGNVPNLGRRNNARPSVKKKRKTEHRESRKEDLGNEIVDGPWNPNAGYGDSMVLRPLTEEERVQRAMVAEKAEAAELQANRLKSAPALEDSSHGQSSEVKSDASSVFYGDSERDYQGRAWCRAPTSIDVSEEVKKCYVPKKVTHVYQGHSLGVQSIEFYPKYGHLLLSASMDTTVRIWDVFNDKRCMRSYHGHTKAVRGIQFNQFAEEKPGKLQQETFLPANDSSAAAACEEFLSFGYDSTVKVWGIETGACKTSIRTDQLPYDAAFSPTEPHVILVASKSKKIIQYDTRISSDGGKNIVQEYDHHLDSVNTVTFYDQGRKFMTTSDDKRILCWEYGVPTPIKYIAEPNMHTVPAVSSHPSGAFLAGQSLDNTILTFDTRKNFSMSKKRIFRGHMVAGYSCQVNFSPNGQYLISGDGQGKLCFWDWNSTKSLGKKNAHSNGPCIGAVWHPRSSSMIATCGWDSTIKLWE